MRNSNTATRIGERADVQCAICENTCRIPENGTGVCGMYTNNGDELMEKYPDQCLVVVPSEITEPAFRDLLRHIDFINIRIKGCTDETYSRFGVRSVAPVFRNLEACSTTFTCLTRREQSSCIPVARNAVRLSLPGGSTAPCAPM
jgi:hypothetical protein